MFYYLYAAQQGVPDALADRRAALTLRVVAASGVVHGVSVTPLMRRHRWRTTERA